jgi:cysteine desulfurase
VLDLCRSAGVPLHVDAAAGFGHLVSDPVLAEADLVSLSAHKLGGPPGAGALVVRRGLRLAPFIVGGQQERARRGGLENVPGIVGFGAAAAALAEDDGARLRAEEGESRRLVAALWGLARQVPGVSLVGDPDPVERLPHLVCLGVEGVEAEPVLLGLDRGGVAAHSGSACASESLEPSPVLEAMGADPSHSLRLSVGWNTTDDDVAGFGSVFRGVVEGLRALRA